MGICIDLNIYKAESLIQRFKDIGVEDEERIRAILSDCGRFVGDEYIILNNEYYDEYNPYYSVIDILDTAFGIESQTQVFHEVRETEGINSVDRVELFEKYGLKEAAQ